MVGHIRSNLYMTIYTTSDVHNMMLDQILEKFPSQLNPNLSKSAHLCCYPERIRSLSLTIYIYFQQKRLGFKFSLPKY